MTIERILARTPGGPLLGGLSWRPPSGGRHTLRRLHEARNLTTDATHYTLLATQQAVVYGLFQPRPSEEAVKLEKGVLAAAHCFAARVGAEAPNGALLLTVPVDDHRKDEKVYVVVLEDGVPVVDSLTTEMEARNALGSEDRPLWSDSASLYPNSRPADLAWLGEDAPKAARVVPIPLNPWPLLTATVLVGAGCASWWVLHETRRAEAEREQARLQAAADPVPRYLAELDRQSARMLSSRDDWLAEVSRLFDRPVSVPGWRMKSVECDTARRRCDTVWQRRGGTFDELKAALPGETLSLQGTDANPVPALDQARTSSTLGVSRHGASGGRAVDFPRFMDAIAAAGPLFQVWKTAQLGVDLQPPRLWPRVDTVPPQFSHGQALMSGVVTLSDVPGPFVMEALKTAPPWISWESVRADIGESDPAARLKFKAMGVYYVSLR